MASNGDTISAVTAIAEWCEDKAEKYATAASQQFRLIVIAVAVGLVLILILPALIASIDNLLADWIGRVPASRVLKDARESVEQLGRQVEASKTHVDKQSTQLSDLKKRLGEHAKSSAVLLRQAEKLLSEPFAFGRFVEISEASRIVIYAQAITDDRIAYAAGRDRIRLTNKMVILRSHNGRSWLPVHPTDANGNRISGIVRALAVGKNGTLYAAGSEGKGSGGFMSILRLRRGRRWSSMHPVDKQGKRIAGVIYALGVANSGVVFAAGYERRSRNLEMTVFRSSDGRTWTPDHPMDTDKQRIVGVIFALVIGKKDALYVAGRVVAKPQKTSRAAVLRRASDNEEWETVQLTNSEGAIYAMTVLKNGSLVAAGIEGRVLTGSISIFQSSNGKAWRSAHPIDSKGNRIRGAIRALVSMPDDRVVGVGRFSFNNILIHSKGGRPWATLPAMIATSSSRAGQFRRNLRTVGFSYSVVAKRNGDIHVAGLGTRLMVFRPGEKNRLPWREASIDKPSKTGANPEAAALDSLIAMFSGANRVFANGALGVSRRAGVLKALWAKDREAERRANKIFKEATQTLTIHKDTHGKVAAGTKELASTQIDADRLRQASRIASRIAIVALLIYLVQIVFNRYRYLQRMSGFYRARGQALRILSTSAELGGSMLANVSAPDLMAALSPDAIGFDKSAKPPAQNMMSIMREVLRPEKKT